MEMLWDQILNDFMEIQVKNPDEEMAEFIQKIMMVKPEIKHACFVKFMQRIQLKYSAAMY